MLPFDELLELHGHVKEKSITNRLIYHKDLVSLIGKYTLAGSVEKKVYGQSVNGRSIYHLKLGNGPTKVLMWTQMHGNEPTATAAVCDILNMISAGTKDYQKALDELLAKLTIHIIPMVNPDGAEQFIRYNALGVDLNRDALSFVSPEATLLKKAQDEIKPDFAFNLHDQRRVHGVSNSGKPATLSFLAPDPYPGNILPNNQKTAMRLIAQLYKVVKDGELNGHVARYDDEFTATAFGDNFQKWGPATILLESGGFYKDYERQVPRKYNFALLLTALKSIANEEHKAHSTAQYMEIPENKQFLHDIIFKNIMMRHGAFEYHVDLAIDLVELPKGKTFEYRIYVAKIGDLRLFKTYQEIDGSQLEAKCKTSLQSESYESFIVVDRDSGKLVYDFTGNIVDPILKVAKPA